MIIGLGLVLAFAVGGFPTGVLLGKIAYGQDIRTLGSGNPGAVNVWRVFGLQWGLLVLVLDAAKGWVGVRVIPDLVGAVGDVDFDADWRSLMGLSAIFGHIWSPYLGFRGGKGVATALGYAWAVHPAAAAGCLGVWLVVAVITRYSSVASIIAAACYPGFAFISADLAGSADEVVGIVLPVLIIYTHRANLRRLWTGSEMKIGQKEVSTPD